MTDPILPVDCTLIISSVPITIPAIPWNETSGAMVEFHGVVRAREDNRQITAIDYECFEEMARVQFARLFAQAYEQWELHTITLHHRIGLVQAGEPSLYLRVSAAHRTEAFAACQWLIDEMKKSVPIWKKPVD